MKEIQMKKTVLLIITAAFCTSAGWFECYNFKGFIGKYPITLSIQILDGFHGESNKKDFNVFGIYKYDKFNNPIGLSGKYDRATGRVELYEGGAQFAFSFSKTKTSGTWVSSVQKKELPLSLTFKDELIDTFNIYKDTTAALPGPVEIIMDAATEMTYFVGVYDFNFPKYSYSRAMLLSLDIYDKKSNKLLQKLEVPERAGNISTIIYHNAWLTDENQLRVTLDEGRIGTEIVYDYDSLSNRYERYEE